MDINQRKDMLDTSLLWHWISPKMKGHFGSAVTPKTTT